MEEDLKMPEEADGGGNWAPLPEEEGFDVEIEDGMVEEVMKGLEMEINGPDFLFPYLSSDFVTINGNEESCGPSFSDSASTVMASIDMGGAGFFGLVGPMDLCCCGVGPGTGFKTTEEEGAGVAADVEESDEEWLARVLSSPPFEFEF